MNHSSVTQMHRLPIQPLTKPSLLDLSKQWTMISGNGRGDPHGFYSGSAKLQTAGYLVHGAQSRRLFRLKACENTNRTVKRQEAIEIAPDLNISWGGRLRKGYK